MGGFVRSDLGALRDLWSVHHVAAWPADAIRQFLEAGGNMQVHCKTYNATMITYNATLITYDATMITYNATLITTDDQIMYEYSDIQIFFLRQHLIFTHQPIAVL